MSVLVFNQDIMVWELFAIIGILLVLAEIFVSGFFVLPVGLAFLIAALVATFTTSWLLVLSVLGVSLLFLFWLFQVQLKWGESKISAAPTNVDAMVGSEVEVVEAIEGSKSGYVKLYGDRWVALSKAHKSFEVGDRVTIIKVDGNKVIVD